MKRFMLVSLMSCMLVGQVSCEWRWSEFGKGAGRATLNGGEYASLGAAGGFLSSLWSSPCMRAASIKTKWGALLGLGAAGLDNVMPLSSMGYLGLERFLRPRYSNLNDSGRPVAGDVGFLRRLPVEYLRYDGFHGTRSLADSDRILDRAIADRKDFFAGNFTLGATLLAGALLKGYSVIKKGRW